MTHNTGERWVATPSELVTEAVMANRLNEKFKTRFWSKVDRYGECWVWVGALSSEGYGNFSVTYQGKEYTVRAHRVAWMLEVGLIEDDLFLDHRADLCQGRWCVNPKHLEPITNQENTKRGLGIGKLRQRQSRDEELQRRNSEQF